jgi:GntR family transcriptional repressor for pyruvate dehydrogenase complex
VLQKVRSTTLVEQVVQGIQEYIKAQHLAPGASLPSSATFAERMGVSRAVIREAFKTLEAKGVIQIANGKNAVVKPITTAPLLDFFQRAVEVDRQAIAEFIEVRKGLEIQSAALAAERRSAGDLAAMQSTLVQMREQRYELERYTELDLQLHTLIARATQNTMMARLIEALRELLTDVIYEGRRRRDTEEQIERMVALHEALVAEIAAGDGEAAGRAMAQHFDAIAMSVGTGAHADLRGTDQPRQTVE